MPASGRRETKGGGQSNETTKITLKRKPSSKTKTGCITCRFRRIKCDERKPACSRCMSTGRTCDGYQTLFRNVVSSPVLANKEGMGRPLSIYRPKPTLSVGVNGEELIHLFKIKSRGSNIDYYTEAQATLKASSDPAIHHALISFDALYKAVEAHGYISNRGDSTTRAKVQRGLEEYNRAISNLASRVVDQPNPAFVRISLLCCQLFIGIEVRLGNFSMAVQHFARGLRIMHQYRCRPGANVEGILVSSIQDDLPLLDLFVFKLFATANPTAWQLKRPTGSQAETVNASASGYIPLRSQARIELATLCTQITTFLSHVSALKFQHQVQGLLEWKLLMLDTLQKWHNLHAESIQKVMDSNAPKELRYAVAFSMFFYQILKIVTSLAISNSADDFDALTFDFGNLDCIASFLTKRRQEFTGNF